MGTFDAFRVRRFTAAALLMVGVSSIYAQKISSADPEDVETAKLVAKMIPHYHLSRVTINNEVSETLYNEFFNDLDPQKLYFLQSDIDAMKTHFKTLDDEVKAGDLEFAYEVFDRYKKLIDQQIEVAQKLIDEDFDFTVDESIEIDGDKLEWSQTPEERNERWRKRIKYDLLQFKLDGMTIEEARERLHKRYRNSRLLVDQYNRSEEMEVFLTALAQCFDPHSSYMSPQTWEDFEIQMRLSLEGIGAQLQADDGYTVVKEIVPGGAAADDGRLKVGDKIIGVGQKEGDIEDIFEMKLNEVVRMIRGPKGTEVRLQVKPENGGDSKVIQLTRKKIELTESEVKGDVIDTSDRIGRPGKVGVISLPSFYRDFAGAAEGGDFKSAAIDVAQVLNRFSKENVDAVIVDLRGNGGGSLAEAIEISGEFIDRGPVVQVKDPTGRVRALDDEEPGLMYTGPLIVLCNRLSASASEIFAGVIKDYHRGLIVGDTTTHGKGTVQNLMEVAPQQPFIILREPAEDRGKLKLTIQQFYRVNGDSTQNKGVPSDIVLPSQIDHWELGEQYLDHALPFDHINPARYPSNHMVNADLVAKLQKSSAERVAQDADFQKLNEAIQHYLARKGRTTMPLNEEKARAERAVDQEAEVKQDETAVEAQPAAKDRDDVFPDRFYENEVLSIALDYVAALKGDMTVSR